jgi:triosephosphate isomerase (TIM)
MEHSRKIFIGGNWKSNGDLQFVKNHTEFLNSIEFDSQKCEVSVSPIFIHLYEVLQSLNSKYIVSSQNVSMFDNGAYTGEISAKQLKDLGVNWTIIGHSERRQYFGENEEVIAKKVKIALDNGLNVIACIGEKLSEREAGQFIDVVSSQMKTLVASVSEWSRVVIAYEPVWAIGTGVTATKEQAQEVHAEIRKFLASNVSDEVARQVRIIYGGSVTEKNAEELITQTDIDGFLVGGASLKTGFKTIIESYKFKHN